VLSTLSASGLTDRHDIATALSRLRSRLVADPPANPLWLGLAIGIPVAAAISLPPIRLEADRAAVAFALAVAWVPVVLNGLRAHWVVVIAAIVEVFVALSWSVYMWLAATPCAQSGRGPLLPTPQCPVQATHFVSAVLGGIGCLVLWSATFLGLRHLDDHDPRTARLLRIAVLAGSLLILAWLVADTPLPRNHPSD
jgi:hypothetical protein